MSVRSLYVAAVVAIYQPVNGNDVENNKNLVCARFVFNFMNVNINENISQTTIRDRETETYIELYAHINTTAHSTNIIAVTFGLTIFPWFVMLLKNVLTR